jgi:hypothetical protein
VGIDPASLAVIATVTSTVLSVGGQIMQGAASSRAAEYQAQVARNNAEIARNNQVTMENNARATEAAGAARADQEAMATREMIGKQKVSAAASGLDIGSGTPLDITAGTAGMGMWSGLNIRDETNRRAAAQRQQGASYGAQAGNFDLNASAADDAASSAMTGGILGAAGELGKGYTKTTGMLAEFKRTGTPMFIDANIIT